MSATLNGLRALTVRLFVPFVGAWWADVDVDPDVIATAPSSGPATIAIATATPITLTGVIDPRATGSFVAGARARVVGGAGGWDQLVGAESFQNPAASMTTQDVYTATAALVGETAVDQTPIVLGTDFERSSGPASRVFRDRVWWVDLASPQTFVGIRPPATPDPTLELLDWDPTRQIATVSADALVVPGTVLVDPRIPTGPVIVRDVDQTFGPSGSRALLYCSSTAVSRLSSTLSNLVNELGHLDELAIYRYRYVQAAPGGAMAMQAVARDVTGAASPMPDLPVLPQGWAGMAGLSATLPPSLQVLVAFIQKDPSQPVIVGYSTLALPLTLNLDASVTVNVGPSAKAVALAGGGAPVGRVGDQVQVTLSPADALLFVAPSGGGGCVLSTALTLTGTITKGSPKVGSG